MLAGLPRAKTLSISERSPSFAPAKEGETSPPLASPPPLACGPLDKDSNSNTCGEVRDWRYEASHMSAFYMLINESAKTRDPRPMIDLVSLCNELGEHSTALNAGRRWAAAHKKELKSHKSELDPEMLWTLFDKMHSHPAGMNADEKPLLEYAARRGVESALLLFAELSTIPMEHRIRMIRPFAEQGRLPFVQWKLSYLLALSAQAADSADLLLEARAVRHESVKWARRWAPHCGNDTFVYFQLAYSYAYGAGVKQSHYQAVRWAHRAIRSATHAKQGYTLLWKIYGQKYEGDHLGLPADENYRHVLCMRYLVKAAHLADGESILYWAQVCPAKDAIDWLKKALPDIAARVILGLFYQHGHVLGLQTDASQAVACYQEAAAADCGLAYLALSVCFRDGFGVAQNQRTALDLERKAKSQNVIMADLDETIEKYFQRERNTEEP